MAGIYIHIPFCERKCSYCDFYSIEDQSLQNKFITALINEIELNSSKFNDELFETIYFGGGTPSVLPANEIEKILDSIYSRYSISTFPEVTIEVNPGTITPGSLKAYRTAGINRLSIGVQSFDEDDLRFLTRIHNSNQAIAAIESARNAEFNNLGIDLIYGLPGQSIDRWSRILKTALQYSPEHISAYSLILEHQTPLFNQVNSGKIILPPDELIAGLYAETMEYLDNAGYEHYEVSNYSQPGKASQHNRNYWMHQTYLGLGPSAHSFKNDNRWWNFKNISIYIHCLKNGNLPVEGSEKLDSNQLLTESIMFGMRMGKLDFEYLQNRFGVKMNEKTDALINSLVNESFLFKSNNIVKLTNRGFIYCDEIIKQIIATV